MEQIKSQFLDVLLDEKKDLEEKLEKVRNAIKIYRSESAQRSNLKPEINIVLKMAVNEMLILNTPENYDSFNHFRVNLLNRVSYENKRKKLYMKFKTIRFTANSLKITRIL